MTGGKAGERYRLVKDKTVIGRHPGCDIVVNSGAVSRQHAVVEMKQGSWWVEDLGSRNGTLINGRKLSGPHQLEAADEIGVCEDRLVFTVGDTTPCEWVSLGGETDPSESIFQSHDEESVIVSQLDIPRPSADGGVSQKC